MKLEDALDEAIKELEWDVIAEPYCYPWLETILRCADEEWQRREIKREFGIPK